MTEAQRLWRRIHKVAEIWRSNGGGVTQPSDTDEVLAAKELAASLTTRGATATSREQSA